MSVINLALLPKSVLNWNGGVDFFSFILQGIVDESISNQITVKVLGTEEDRRNIDGILIKYNTEFILIDNISKECIAAKLKENKIDIIFAFQTDLGKYMSIPWVGYIPDFQHKYLTQYFSEEEKNRRDIAFQEIMTNSDALIVNSLDTKNDIEKFLCVDNEKVKALPFTPFLRHKLDKDSVDLEKIKFTYLLKEKYFMISNQFWMHKNHILAFKAFKLFIENNPEHSDILLVCTGGLNDYRNSEYIEEVKSFISENNLEEKIILLGLVEKGFQLNLMNECLAVIQPTLFEGGPGGGATYDALSLGKKVILSDLPINLEIKNPDVLFFGRNSEDELVKVMERVLKTKEIIAHKINNNERNKELLGRSLYSIFKEILDKKESNRKLNNIFDYSSLNPNIKKSIRITNEELSVFYSNSVCSSVAIVDEQFLTINKSISADYFAGLFACKHHLDSTNKLAYLYSNEELFSITLNNYIKEYVLYKVNDKKTIYIYADGGHTEALINCVDFSEFKLLGILSKEPRMKSIESYPVIKYKSDIISDDAYILISSATYEEEIYNELCQEIAGNKILRIYG